MANNNATTSTLFRFQQGFRNFLKRVPTVTRYLLIGGVVLLISLLFPNQLAFNYQFERGSIWRYEDMVAPFDFAIQKPDAEYKAEIEALEAKLFPFYVKDSQVTTRQLERFSQSFLLKLQSTDQALYRDVRSHQDNYRNAGRRILISTFKKGVLQLAPQHTAEGDNKLINVLMNANRVERRVAKSLSNTVFAKATAQDSLYELSNQLVEIDFLLDIMDEAIIPNIVYSDSLTRLYHELEKEKISQSKDRVIKGELIVRRGDVLDEATYQKLISLKTLSQNRHENRNEWLTFSGYLLLTILLVSGLMLYLYFYENALFSSIQKLSFILMWLLLYSYLSYFINQVGFIDAYFIPFCIAPIVIKNFYNERVAFFTHLVTVLLAGFLAAQSFEFLFVQILMGIVIVLADVRTRNWSSFFISIVYLLVTYVIAFLALSITKENSLENIDGYALGWIGLNIFLTLLAYPLIPLLERVFGFTSEITLIELSSLDRPLLKELSLKAPGTLQHSLQVGNLAENAAAAIGADALLVKVAALYHDIGKVNNPFFFIENQSGQNPHQQLTPLQSAEIILAHVTDGEKRAKKEGLPKVLIDFITTHHGSTRVEYFYRKHLQENPDEVTDPQLFTYKGSKPQTKEQAILMMADSLEAASKSLKNPDESSINNLVDNIIAGKIQSAQFSEVDLTYREMDIVKSTFKKLLKSIYHVRIAYPSEK